MTFCGSNYFIDTSKPFNTTVMGRKNGEDPNSSAGGEGMVRFLFGNILQAYCLI